MTGKRIYGLFTISSILATENSMIGTDYGFLNLRDALTLNSFHPETPSPLAGEGRGEGE